MPMPIKSEGAFCIRGESPAISIALCTYNGARHLPQQIESLRAQTYADFEVVAVDDASSDASWEMLQQTTFDRRFRVYRNAQNLGLVGNFAQALSRCRAPLIALCDQDDIWAPDKLERLTEAMGSAAAVYCDSQLIDESGRDLGLRVSDRVHMYEGHDPAAFVFSNCVAGHAMLLRRSVLEHALPFPQIQFHDWWLAAVAAAQGGIRYLPQPLVQYRQHQASRTDFTRRKAAQAVKPVQDRLRLYENRAHWIKALAQIPGSSQPYLQALHRANLSLARQWFSIDMWRLLRERGDVLFQIDRKASRRPLSSRWKYSTGIPLKQLFDSSYPRRSLRLPVP